MSFVWSRKHRVLTLPKLGNLVTHSTKQKNGRYRVEDEICEHLCSLYAFSSVVTCVKTQIIVGNNATNSADRIRILMRSVIAMR